MTLSKFDSVDSKLSPEYAVDYVVAKGVKMVVDARDITEANLTRFINDPCIEDLVNCEITTQRVSSRKPRVRATQGIPAGSELFLSYGDQYRSHFKLRKLSRYDLVSYDVDKLNDCL